MKKGIGTVISTLAGAAAGAAAVGTSSNKKLKRKDEGLKKVHELYMAFDQWLRIRQEGKTLVEYFHQQNFKTIAIYGMKELGEHLYEELKDADSIYADVDVITPDDDLEQVDVIVVTAIYYFDEIEEMLSQKVDYPVISLEDVLYEI